MKVDAVKFVKQTFSRMELYLCRGLSGLPFTFWPGRFKGLDFQARPGPACFTDFAPASVNIFLNRVSDLTVGEQTNIV